MGVQKASYNSPNVPQLAWALLPPSDVSFEPGVHHGDQILVALRAVDHFDSASSIRRLPYFSDPMSGLLLGLRLDR
jgi:hypothetical protein